MKDALISKSTFSEFHAPLWELSSRIHDLTLFWGHMSDSKKTLIEKAKTNSRIESDLSLQKDRFKTLEREERRLRDLKDSEENLVERKITQDASGNRSVRGVRARSARISIISLFHVSVMSLKLQEYHSYRSLIPCKKINARIHTRL